MTYEIPRTEHARIGWTRWERDGVVAQYPCGHRGLFGKSEDVDTLCPWGCGQTVASTKPVYSERPTPDLTHLPGRAI